MIPWGFHLLICSFCSANHSIFFSKRPKNIVSCQKLLKLADCFCLKPRANISGIFQLLIENSGYAGMGRFASGCAFPGTDEVCFSCRSCIAPYASSQWPGKHHRVKSIPPGCVACIGKCRSKGFGALPNKHFAAQNKQMYIRLHCLPQQCDLSVRIQRLSVLVKHECCQEENHSNPHEPRDNFLLMKLSESQWSYKQNTQ